LNELAAQTKIPAVQAAAESLSKTIEPIRRDIFVAAKQAIRSAKGQASKLQQWLDVLHADMQVRYSSELHNNGQLGALSVSQVAPLIDEEAEQVDGRIILRDFWDMKLAAHPEILIFGEDVGKIGGVNQTCEGLQEKSIFFF
jgi:hypothetical protein